MEEGARHIRCAACHALSKAALGRARRRKALGSEEQLSDIVTNICVGTPEGSEEYPKYPGNPPVWGEMYRTERDAGSGTWRLKRLGKREPAEERGGGAEYEQLVMKHAMISRACKAVIEESEHDLGELVYRMSAGEGRKPHAPTAAALAEAYCEAACAGEDKDEL